MKSIPFYISTFFKQRLGTTASTGLKVDRLKERILPLRYFDEDDGSLFI